MRRHIVTTTLLVLAALTPLGLERADPATLLARLGLAWLTHLV